MNDDHKKELDSLLNDRIITKQEYDIFMARISKPIQTCEILWADIIDGYYEYCSDKYTDSTVKGYKTCLMRYVMYVTNQDDYSKARLEKFEMFTFSDINIFIEWLFNQGLESVTISKIKYSLNVLCNYLNSINLKAPDIEDIKLPKQKAQSNEIGALRKDEIYDIAENANIRAKICILLCYECALKRQEISRVKFSDIDYEKNQIRIYDDQGKFEKACFVSQHLLNLIKDYKYDLYLNIDKWNDSRNSKGFPLRNDYGYIFQNIKTATPSYSMLQTLIKEAAKQYYGAKGYIGTDLNDRISCFTFETLKNSKKLYLLAKGNTVQEVMNIIGDKNYMSTYKFVKYVAVFYPELTRKSIKD